MRHQVAVDGGAPRDNRAQPHEKERSQLSSHVTHCEVFVTRRVLLNQGWDSSETQMGESKRRTHINQRQERCWLNGLIQSRVNPLQTVISRFVEDP